MDAEKKGPRCEPLAAPMHEPVSLCIQHSHAHLVHDGRSQHVLWPTSYFYRAGLCRGTALSEAAWGLRRSRGRTSASSNVSLRSPHVPQAHKSCSSAASDLVQYPSSGYPGPGASETVSAAKSSLSKNTEELTGTERTASGESCSFASRNRVWPGLARQSTAQQGCRAARVQLESCRALIISKHMFGSLTCIKFRTRFSFVATCCVQVKEIKINSAKKTSRKWCTLAEGKKGKNNLLAKFHHGPII